jgi:hypothetical protein
MERFSGVQTAGRGKNCPKEQVSASPILRLALSSLRFFNDYQNQYGNDFPATLRSANWSPDGRMLVAWGKDSTTQQVMVRVYEI